MPLRREWGVNNEVVQTTPGRPCEHQPIISVNRRHSTSVLGVTQHQANMMTRQRGVGSSVLGNTACNPPTHRQQQPVPLLQPTLARPNNFIHNNNNEHRSSQHHIMRRSNAGQPSELGVGFAPVISSSSQQRQSQRHLQFTQPAQMHNYYNHLQQQQQQQQQRTQASYLPQTTQPYWPQEFDDSPPIAQQPYQQPPPPPPYSTMPRYPTTQQPLVLQPRRISNNNKNYYPSYQQQPELIPANINRFDLMTGTCGKGGVLMHPRQQQQLFSQKNRGYYDVNPVDIFGDGVVVDPPSPQSVDLEGFDASSQEIEAPYILNSFTTLEVFIKIFALFSLLFPPTGIGAVVCAFTANKETSQRFRSARQKVSLILASVGFTVILLIVVVVIIATQVVH